MALKESFAIIIFGGAYHYRRATCYLKQISKYITLKSSNSILNISYINTNN